MRVTLVGISILIQAAILMSVVLEFGNYFVYFYAISLLFSLLVVLGINPVSQYTGQALLRESGCL